MTASTLIVDYLGQGLAADRPATPNVPAGAIAIYCSTDTGDVDFWFDGSWMSFGAGSGITELTGDVTAGPGSGSQAATIANDAVTTAKIIDDAVTNAKLANMPAFTFKVNTTSGSATPQDADYATVAAALASYFPGSSFIISASYASNHTIGPGEAGFHFDNDGASGDIALTLPAAADGLTFAFAVYAAHYLRINADGSDTISLGADTSAGGGYVRSNVPHSFLFLEAHGAGKWVASSVVGAWGIDGGAPAVVLTDADIGSSVAPATSGTDILKGDGSGGFDPAVAGTDYAEATPGSADDPLFSDGAGGFTAGTRHGDTTDVATVDGATTAGNAAIWDADGNLIDAGAPPGSGGGFTAVTKTTDYTVLSGDSGTVFNNDGASGDIVLSLPAAVPELTFGAAIHAAHHIKFLADGTDPIAIGTDNSAGGGYVRSNAPYSRIQIECHVAGQWVASTMVGSWGIDV